MISQSFDLTSTSMLKEGLDEKLLRDSGALGFSKERSFKKLCVNNKF